MHPLEKGGQPDPGQCKLAKWSPAADHLAEANVGQEAAGT